MNSIDNILYVGTYTKPEDHVDGHAEGIYVFRFDGASGSIDRVAAVSDIVNPSYLTLHPARPFLYAVSETNDFGDTEMGGVVSYRIDPGSGSLKKINEVPSMGTWPCHVSVEKDGRHAFVANYVSGSIASYRIRDDGSLTEAVCAVQRLGKSINPERQEGPHAHAVVQDLSGGFILVPDLGTDNLAVYRFDPGDGSLKEKLPAVSVDPGSGPRHVEFHTSGRFLYLINELSSTIIVYRYSPEECGLEHLQTVSVLPEDFSGDSACAAVKISPSGRHLYASNRGHDSVSWFDIDETTGRLALIGWESTRGKTPRDFMITPDGRFLLAANQDSDSVVMFRVDQESGGLEYRASETVASPVCLVLS